MPVELEPPRLLRLLKVTVLPTIRQCRLSELCAAQDLMTLDLKTLELKKFCLPVVGEKRVPPSEWRALRLSHRFQGPCCLCPLFQRLHEKPRYKEAAIYLTLRGLYKGEYVAECAESRCGYLVPIERFYVKSRVTVKKYILRNNDEPGPNPCFHHSESSMGEPFHSTTLQRTATEADFRLGYTTDWRKIVKLDSLDRPGLRAKEFYGLFAMCDTCELVVARQVFSYHYCHPVGEDGLELDNEEVTTEEE